MSRVGQAPITVPDGVDVTIAGAHVTAKGSNGTLEHDVPRGITVTLDDGTITVERGSDERSQRALHGLTRSLIANMVEGVSTGFSRELQIQGVGYRAQSKGTSVELQVGYSHPVVFEAPEGITIEVPEPTQVIVKGADKQLVGQVAADIRKVRTPEPYKGKGIRYVDEHVRRKAGKAAVGSGA
ncbi:MAG: 50S ribosomal protein L6 [Acidimicrobiia bacterium]